MKRGEDEKRNRKQRLWNKTQLKSSVSSVCGRVCETHLRLVRLWISSVSHTHTLLPLSAAGWAAMSPKTAPLNISKPAGNFAPRYTHACKYREWLRPQTMAPASPLAWSLTHHSWIHASTGRRVCCLLLACWSRSCYASSSATRKGPRRCAACPHSGHLRNHWRTDPNLSPSGHTEHFQTSQLSTRWRFRTDFRHCAASGSFCWLTCEHVWTELSKPRRQYLQVWKRRHLQVISVEITTIEGHVLGQRSIWSVF